MKKILVLGAGYAGISFLNSLDEEILNNNEVIIINNNSYHCHTALLYKVAGLECENRAQYPLKDIIDERVKIVCEKVIKINKNIVITDENEYKFDYLIIALGYGVETYEITGAKNLPNLANFENALEIAKNIEAKIANFATTNDKNDLKFIVCGGGFSGVELVGTMQENIKKLCERYSAPFRDVEISLIEATERILPMFSQNMSKNALEFLQNLGIKVHLNSQISSVNENEILTKNGKKFIANTIIWVVGTKGNEIVKNCDFALDKGRIKVDEFLRVNDNIFAIGDICAWSDENGKICTQSAQISLKMGKYVAKSLNLLLDDKKIDQPFRYKSLGSVCSIGSKFALGSIFGNEVSGWFGSLMKNLIERKWDLMIFGIRGLLKR